MAVPYLRAVSLRSSVPGIYTLIGDGPAIFIMDLVVHRPNNDKGARPHHKEGDGLGGLLLRALLMRANQLGVDEIGGHLSDVDVPTPERLARLRAFYHRHGFQTMLFDEPDGYKRGSILWMGSTDAD